MDNATSNDNLNSMAAFCEEIINEQGYATLDNETKQTLIADMVQRLVDQIDRAAVDRLTEEQAVELGKKLDAGELADEEVAQYIADCGVNLQEVAIETMVQFRMLYIGGGSDDESAAVPLPETEVAETVSANGNI